MRNTTSETGSQEGPPFQGPGSKPPVARSAPRALEGQTPRAAEEAEGGRGNHNEGEG